MCQKDMMRGGGLVSAVCAMCLAAVALWVFAAAPAGAQTKPKKPPAKPADTAQQLRAEWKMADLKLQHEAVDDTAWAADLKQNAMSALTTFLQQQETLVAQVQQDPAAAAAARKQRATAAAQFQQKMTAIYSNPQMMAELYKRMQAMDDEMDDMAGEAAKIFAKLDAAGITPAQKAKVKPVIDDAKTKIKKAVAKSGTQSTKDAAVRDDVVKVYKDAKAKVKQELTPQQKAKLAQADAK